MRGILLGSCLLAVTLTGCGGPTLDASSDQTLKDSMERMTADMSDKEKVQFGMAVAKLTVKDTLQNALQNIGDSGLKGLTSPTEPSEVFKSMDGMTADEIIAKAK